MNSLIFLLAEWQYKVELVTPLWRAPAHEIPPAKAGTQGSR